MTFRSLCWSPVTHAKSVLVQRTRARLMLHVQFFYTSCLSHGPVCLRRERNVRHKVTEKVEQHCWQPSPVHVRSTSRITERTGAFSGSPRVACAFLHVQRICTSDCVSVRQIKNSWCSGAGSPLWSTFGSQVAKRGTQRSSLQVLPPQTAFSHRASLVATRSWPHHSCPWGLDLAVGRLSP